MRQAASSNFSNHLSCKPFAQFISYTLIGRLTSGAICLWDKVREPPPRQLEMQKSSVDAGSPSDLLSSTESATFISTRLHQDLNRLKLFCLCVLGVLISVNWDGFLRLGMFRAGLLCIFHSVLGLSSTRDCWCPFSTIGVRETDENR